MQERSVTTFVDGKPWEFQDKSTVDVINPSNGRQLFSIPAGCDADVDRAVASARLSFEDGRWRNMPPSLRKKNLLEFSGLVAAEAAALDALDAEEMGKPIREPRANAASAAALMRFYAEAADKVTGDVYGSDKHSIVMQRRVPRGVVAAIVPWNFPTSNAVLKIGPALAAGNSVVLKPSELSSRSALRLAQLAVQAGIPPGTFNVILGLGETVGKALALHRDVDMVTFTGSTDVGKKMLQYSGQSNMKTVMAECGGKSPHIVFDDGVDLDAASVFISRALLSNQGQICSVGSRLLAQRSIASRMVDIIAARFGQVVMGNALDPETTFGPIASEKQCQRVMRYIESAQAEGNELVTGGRRALRESGGYFVEPTLFRNVAPAARIAQEEVFGPVLSVIPFDDEAEAVRIANGTQYGLMAYVWTTDLSKGIRMTKAIRSSVRVHATAPQGEGAGFMPSFEPCALSGVGVEGGWDGLESYLRRQMVAISHA